MVIKFQIPDVPTKAYPDEAPQYEAPKPKVITIENLVNEPSQPTVKPVMVVDDPVSNNEPIVPVSGGGAAPAPNKLPKTLPKTIVSKNLTPYVIGIGLVIGLVILYKL